MAYSKVYTRIIWQNAPSTATALGATNLNKMDSALNTIDDRVVGLDTSKANQSTVNSVVQSITYNDATGVLTITKVNGTSTNIDTKLEKLAVNFSYNPTTQQLDISLDDGTVQHVDMSALVTQYEFLDSDTVDFTVQADGKIKASIIPGSITGDMLQPDYLADIIVQANIATTQAETSVENAQLSKRYAVGGVIQEDAEDNSKYYMEQARIARDEAGEIAGFDPNTKLDKASVVNNVSTVVEGYALDARQGKELQDQIDDNVSQLAQIQNDITSVFNPASTYALGSYCIHQDILYKCTTPISVPTAWNVTNWTATSVGAELSLKLDTSKIADNFVTNDPTFALSAKKGKELKDSLGSLLTVKSFTVLTGVVAALSAATVYVDISYPGYTALGIVGHNNNGAVSSWCTIHELFLNTATTAVVSFRNMYTPDSTDATTNIVIYVLYIKS
ncbi:MAG: hypothetical protein ACK5JH_15175 [Anaerocolumna sp.]